MSKGDYKIEANGSITGNVLKVLRKTKGDEGDGFVIDAEPPGGHLLERGSIIVVHPDGFTHGYKIKHVLQTAEQTIIAIADEPGFEIGDDGKTRFLFFPQRECEGENRFYIEIVKIVQFD